MLRHPRLIAVCACIVASVGCDGGKLPAPAPLPHPPTVPPITTVTVEFGGRVVNADAGGPVGNVRVSLYAVIGLPGGGTGWQIYAKDTATSGGDGEFTLPLSLPMGWTIVYFQLTAPPGYDDTYSQGFEPTLPQIVRRSGCIRRS